MKNSKPNLANQIVVTSVRLIRWLRASDPAPQFTPAQVSAMGIIIFSGGITPSALAELEEVKRPTIARTIHQLEDRGLIERIRDSEDGRSSLLKPTKAGFRLFREGQKRSEMPLAKALNKLSKEERELIEQAFRILERAIAA